ncbi:hypothetical protein FQN54_003011 [Arachnomyces sp. PD_36]|nr:hypothetical protein FQN54_003011 [Arachnomyces sp. PD_36]
MATLQVAKKELRKKLRKILSDIPKESAAAQSTTATNKLFALPEYRSASRISVYLSMPSGEISTLAIVRDALGQGKQVFVPYIYKIEAAPNVPRTSLMDMLALHSMEEFEGLKPDNWGIPSLDESTIANRTNCLGGHGLSVNQEPSTKTAGSGLDMIVMPGMAFDEGFRRLGHGKGYYDHFLRRYKELQNTSGTPQMPYLVALALEEQILPPSETVPVGDHDWPVDAVIIGNGRVLTSKS